MRGIVGVVGRCRRARRHDAEAVLIEDRGSGVQLIQALREEDVHAIPIAPEADKATRLCA